MLNKILSFIINNDNKILLLHNNPLDPTHGEDFWYTVTGGFEDYDKTAEDVVKREIKEETNLDVKEVMYLNWILKYKDKGLNCVEYVYISFVENSNITLDESENIDYEWCDIDDFVKKIRWFGDLELLKKVLIDGMTKKVYFHEEKIENYDFNFEIINGN
jgi:8-oxo-dGTP pyrophosphatase MutT (NUDIX family)